MSNSIPDPSRAGPDAVAEIEKLTRENLMLQAKVAEFHLLEQKLLNSNHLLEIESARFDRMKAFIRSVTRPIAIPEMCASICEFIVDILECEIGLFWCFRTGRGIDAVFTSGRVQVDEDSWPELRSFLESWLEATGCPGTHNRQNPPPCLNIGEFLVRGVIGDEGECFGILLSANTNRVPSLYEPLHPGAVKPFDAFAEQVSAVIESRRGRAVILEQAAKLRISEQRLATALEKSNVGLWDWNILANTIYFSPQWKMQLGYEDEEISDCLEEWKCRLHPDDFEMAVANSLRCADEPGASFETTLRMMHRDGEWRWIICSGTCVADHPGPAVHMIGTHIDITSLKEIEARLRTAEESQRIAKEGAMRANVAKSEFLAKISHEIRTHLNGVLAAFQMLQGGKLSSKARKLVEMGSASGRWMLGIIGESLDLAQIETGRLKLHVGNFELSPMLKELEETAAITARRKWIQVGWKQSSRLPVLGFGDRSRVKQVVANLIDNAVKFTPDGGRVTVAVNVIPARNGGESCLRFRVIDTGPGFASENIPHIFKPFHQLSQLPGNHLEGMGLGLAIVRELVDLMGGTIKVASRIGRGSAFSVSLPFTALCDEVSCEPLAATPWQRRFSGSVLFAEDDEVSRELGAMVLEKLGLEVTAVVDGLEALEQLQKKRFDLAILDCWMPRLDGIEVATRIRKSEAGGPAMPILALTANAEITNVDACIAAGMNDWIFKPVVVEKLEEKLCRLLPSCRESR
jgi:PAS domain S-box-containing protein